MKPRKKLVNKYEYEGFFRTALALKGSVTPIVFTNVCIIMLYSCLISYLNYLIPEASLPIGPFEYAGLMMGLVLVFRVNAGHDRWWEARKLWGNIVNQSRNFAIIILNYPKADSLEWKIKISNYIAAMPYLIKNNLQNDPSIEDIKSLVDQETLEILIQADNKANALSTIIAHELHMLRVNNKLDDFAFLRAEEKRSLIIDSQGGCERILKTPMPFVMAVKSRRFILFFLLSLPFALVNASIIINPFITAVIAYALFSLDQIGIELQNPFSEDRLSHLPLNEICKTIEKNIMELQAISK
jgi:ion channel-forming bestrophin family protein